MEDKNYFYDIHYHAFDLSHANLSAFLKRILKDKEKSIETLLKNNLPWKHKLFIPFVSYKYLTKKILTGLEDKIVNIQNTLSLYEQPIEDHFLIVEYFLKQEYDNKNKKIPPIIKDKKIQIHNNSYDKLVICPLIIDFGQKSSRLNNKGLYSLMPGKPIVKQVVDLFNSIKNYYSYELKFDEVTGKLNKVKVKDPETKPLRILPFLGINPANYQPFQQKVIPMFKQYFDSYDDDDSTEKRIGRVEESINAFLNFDGKLTNDKGENIPRTNMFFGVKVYPPLGFKPDDEDSIKLFSECIKYNLPVTTHCSDGGFVVNDNSKDNTNPHGAWKEVFTSKANNKPELRKLKLNFAHFGVQKDGQTEWRKAIIDMARQYPNIYTDISSLAHEDGFYSKIEKWLNDDDIDTFDIAKARVLFGSDFSINLMETDSYNSYLYNNNKCDKNWKKNITENNPAKFLFDVAKK